MEWDDCAGTESDLFKALQKFTELTGFEWETIHDGTWSKFERCICFVNVNNKESEPE